MDRALCWYVFIVQERRSALLKKRAEARARGEVQDPSAAQGTTISDRVLDAEGIRFSIDGEEAMQVQEERKNRLIFDKTSIYTFLE